jgi:transposase
VAIDDELWDRIEPLLPPWPGKAPGPRPVPDRLCLQGVLFGCIPGSVGTLRYVVEQTSALLHQFRRLAVRWERRLDIHEAFVSLGCALICWRRLIKWTTERSR